MDKSTNAHSEGYPSLRYHREEYQCSQWRISTIKVSQRRVPVSGRPLCPSCVTAPPPSSLLSFPSSLLLSPGLPPECLQWDLYGKQLPIRLSLSQMLLSGFRVLSWLDNSFPFSIEHYPLTGHLHTPELTHSSVFAMILGSLQNVDIHKLKCCEHLWQVFCGALKFHLFVYIIMDYRSWVRLFSFIKKCLHSIPTEWICMRGLPCVPIIWDADLWT